MKGSGFSARLNGFYLFGWGRTGVSSLPCFSGLGVSEDREAGFCHHSLWGVALKSGLSSRSGETS